VLLAGFLLIYIGYLHLQLYISRRIISALQVTTVVTQANERKLGLKSALSVLGLLLVITGMVLVWIR
jgi:hypothetical protein